MNFVESLAPLHLSAKEIPCLTGRGAPTEKTEGAPGVLYMDTNTGNLYKCRGSIKKRYRWEIQGGSVELTEDDKTEIAALVIEMLGSNSIFGYVNGNNIIVSGELPDGSYTVCYEMADGSTVEIGDLVLDSNVYYAVTNTLTNCVSSNSPTQAVAGGSYSATITANSGYELKSMVVTMGGTDISSTAVSGLTIFIAEVTGNIVITAVAEEKAVTPSYTNWLPLSVDADGSDYRGTNGEDGYKAGYKMSGSSGGESATTGAYCSGFIPIEDIEHYVYIKNIALHSGANVNNIVFYNKDKTKLYSASGSTAGSFHTSVKDIGDGVYRFRAFLWITEEQSANLGFFRFSCGGISDDTIVTVNEEIV